MEHEQYKKKKTRSVKIRRFIKRNATIIAVSFIAIFALTLFTLWKSKSRAEQPTTRGMSPIEVTKAYYAAFSGLDHAMMEACVTGRAGRRDIEMVMNLFVVTRMRQIYEMPGIAFGITDLIVEVISKSSEEVNLQADYLLWLPGEYSGEENELMPPESFKTRDKLNLVLQKGAWRITNIDRFTASHSAITQ
jgi:hypothetical protein